MSKEPEALNDISKAVLQVFSQEELAAMSKPQLTNLVLMVSDRLKKEEAPTLAELQGIKELSEHLWSPAFDKYTQK